ncbi:MAG TPA: phosphoenolpyruvate carboxylase [Anaerolineales bacterium]|nr:phosphoenolpyruvate carboxylase [Anaerolineales bacterium]
MKDPNKIEISRIIHLLGDVLGEVISELESPELFAIEERIRLASKDRRDGDAKAAKQLETDVEALDINQARGVSAAFTTYFELVNLAEEQIRVENLRERILSNEPPGESILDAIAQLKKEGINYRQMQDMLDDLSIELVLTAHPTEARRRTVVSKLQRLTRLLDEISRKPISDHQETEIRASIHAEVASLWLTDVHRTERPQVEDEVRIGLQFVESVFWDTLPEIYDDLHDALASHYPDVVAPSNWLRLASWMGGDRDGNPNVDHTVTAETLRLHRGLAVEQHRERLQDLARRLSISSRRLSPQPDLIKWIESRGKLPDHVAYIQKRYPDEPYRLVLSLLATDLAEASKDDMTARLLERKPHEARMKLPDLLEPLDFISAGLPASIAQDEIEKVRYQLHIFGLHSMRLDIREESSRYNAALGETLRALNITPNFAEMPDAERLSFLTEMLSSSLPDLAEHPGITAATAETWALFQLIKRVRDVYGAELLGPVVISMCRSAADVLTVLLLARWAGCDHELQIVPLFETIEDLQDASSILESLFTLELYREHLAKCGNQQMVMIGYSDSNKDGGYVMANWALYQGQENITQVAQKHNVTLTIFHGRGGTIARGGGPANRAIRAQPPGSINGRFRLTEQGETISSRYSNPELAHRHLEQIVHAVLVASSPANSRAEIPGSWRAVMDEMSSVAFRAYRGLVYETPAFIDFWQAATPLDEIKSMHIGSRPAARTKSSEVSKIRAIPWVFSWMQSRFNLPGWFGLGTALESIQNPALLQDMYQGWAFFKSMLDNTEMSLLKADMDIAALYVDLVPDKAMATEIFSLIKAEYDRTSKAVLAISGHQNLLDAERITQHAIQLRNPYVDPLNYIQVEMLRRLRALPESEGAEAQSLREVIRLTINGIAAGLRNTG